MSNAKKIRILADTSTDLTFEQAKKHGIDLFPIPVRIGDKDYRDGVDFTHEEFYNILETSPVVPTTSHIPLSTTGEAYLKAYNDGCEAVIHICNNSKNSGMFSTANIAKNFFFEEHPEAEGKFRIEPVDSHSFSLAYGLPAIFGAKKRDEGGTVDEVLEVIDETVNRVEIYMAVYDLKFAKSSGRISAASAIVGTVIGIKPIISMIAGETVTIDKVRGEKAIIPRLVKAAKDNMEGETFFCVAGGSTMAEAKELQSALEKEFGKKSFGIFELGAAVSINAGPKAIAVYVLGKDRRKA